MDWLIGKRRGRAEKDAPPQEPNETANTQASNQNTNTQPVPQQETARDSPINDLLGDEVFPLLVKLPCGLDEREWLATNTIPFFNNTSLIHSAISEFCTSSTCPNMCVAPGWSLSWIDDKGKKKKCYASKYGDLALSFIQKQINDEALFPTKRGIPFPAHFESVLRRVYRFLFHILGHAYTVHLRQLSAVNLGPQMSCVFKHLIMFSLEFNLLDVKEMEPVSDMVRRLSQISGCTSYELSSYQPCVSNGNSNIVLNLNTNSNSSDASTSSSSTLSSTVSSSNNATSLLSNAAVAGNSAPSVTHLQLQPVA